MRGLRFVLYYYLQRWILLVKKEINSSSAPHTCRQSPKSKVAGKLATQPPCQDTAKVIGFTVHTRFLQRPGPPPAGRQSTTATTGKSTAAIAYGVPAPRNSRHGRADKMPEQVSCSLPVHVTENPPAFFTSPCRAKAKLRCTLPRLSFS